MSEFKEITSKIESLKAKVSAELVEISKHLERLSKLMQEKQNSTAYLRCRGHMRIASAMIKGVNNLKMGSIISEQDVDDTEEETNEE